MPKRILVIEDNDDLRNYYRRARSAVGFDAEEAADGIQALRHPDNHPPDLVVLDLRLPNEARSWPMNSCGQCSAASRRSAHS